MGIYGDPDELDRLAARIRSRAQEVRQRAADHARRGESARWVSTAADAYRERLRQDRANAERVADDLERAAKALNAHADEVRATLARIAEFEKMAVDWFDRQAHGLAERAEQLVSTVGRVLEAPWNGWPYQPGRLPPSGDRQWLDVGRFMRTKGAI